MPSFAASTDVNNEQAEVRLLVVDDDDLIRSLLTNALTEQGYGVATTGSPQEALDMLQRESFDMVFADLCMPGVTGMDLLSRIRASKPELPVVLITGFGDAALARQAMSAGASDFITKPFRAQDLPIIIERNLTRHDLSRRRSLAHKHQLQISYEAVLDALLTALDTRDTETEGHSERVTAYTMLLADGMGVPTDMLYHIERGALLHDIGKIGVSDAILHKPGPLTPAQWAEMKRHPEIGYPSGLKRDQIHIGARIFSVVDTFDAMTTDRPYRSALPYADARAEIAQHAGTQLDPDVVECFLAIPERRWISLRDGLTP